MRKLGLVLSFLSAVGLSLWAWSPLPLQAQIGQPNNVACNQLVFQTASTASLATLLAGLPGKIIYVCGWDVSNSNATAATFQLSSGTGTNCATTNTNITPAFSVSQSAPATDHVAFAQLSLPAGANLCIISSTVTLQPAVWVGQY
jgi:hypothetical protein